MTLLNLKYKSKKFFCCQYNRKLKIIIKYWTFMWDGKLSGKEIWFPEGNIMMVARVF